MDKIEFAFDVTNIDVYVAGFNPLPAGSYAMAIRNMEVKPNQKAETGHNLALEYVVTEGEHKGRKLLENLNLWHKTSTAAAEIAMKQLSSIGHAVGVLAGGDLTLLANKVMMVEVELQEATPDTQNPNTGEPIKGRGPQNRILRRDPYTATAAAATAPHIPASQPVSQPNAAAAQAAPAFIAPAGVAPATQAAPAFNPAQNVPAGAMNGSAPGAGAAATGAVPPWQR